MRANLDTKINFVLVLFLIFIVLGIYSYFSLKLKIQENFYKELSSTNKLVETKIKFWYEDLLRQVNSLEKSTIFWSFLEELSNKKSIAEQKLREFLQIEFKQFAIIEAKIFSENYNKIFFCGESKNDYENEISNLNDNAFKKKGYLIEELVYDKNNNLPVSKIYSTIILNGKRYYLIVKLNARNSLFKLIQEVNFEKHFLETILFTHRNDTLTYISDSRFLGKTAFNLKERTELFRGKDKIFKYKNELFLETKDYRGEPVLAVMNFMQEFDFYILTKVDKSAVISEIKKIYLEIFGTVFLVAIIFNFLIVNLLKKEKEKLERREYELRKAQELLKQKYEYVMHYANDAIVISDLNDRIIDFNHKAIEFYKLNRESINSYSIIDFYPDELKDDWKIKLAEIKNSAGVVFETVHKKINGELFYVQVSARLIKIENYDFILQIIRDFDERKRVEEELTFQKMKAEESDKLKSNFLSMMSHEVRTPVNIILGAVDILKSVISEDTYKNHEHLFDMIYRNSRRLLTLINDIIDISRIESNELKFELTIRNAESLLLDVINEYQSEAKKKSLSIITNFNATNPHIRLDEVRFYQVISNLISNAIKFTSKGGITIITKNINESLHISVKDTGIGIPKDKIGEIFKMFRQAQEGYSRDFEGAGLGLTITEKLVKMMGGEITVESEVGVGSVFTVIFPVVEVEEIDEKLLDQLKDRDKYSVKPLIVVVDNIKDEAFYLESLMTRLGVDYVVLNDGKKLSGIIKHKNVDLIIYSINVLNEDEAKKVITDLRENLKLNFLKVLAVRSKNTVSDNFRLKNLGFDSVIEKPFSFEELSREIYKLISDKNLSR